jgi:hypothetical protein
MYKQANLPINKDLLIQALKGGAIGSGLGGAALGGLTYLTDDSEDPSERSQRVRSNALMGLGLGGLTGAGVGYGNQLMNTPKGPFDDSPIYKFLRNLTMRTSEPATGIGLGAATQSKSMLRNLADKKRVAEWDKGEKLSTSGLLSQAKPLKPGKGSIIDIDGLNKSIEGHIRGTKGKNPDVSGITSKFVNQGPPEISPEGSTSLNRAESIIRSLSQGGSLSDEGLKVVENRLSVPQEVLADQRALAPKGVDFDGILESDRKRVLGNLANTRAGGWLDLLWDKSIGKALGAGKGKLPGTIGKAYDSSLGRLGGTTGTYLDQVKGTAGRKPFGILPRTALSSLLSYLGVKGVNNIAPHTTDPLYASPEFNKQMIDQYLKQQRQ